MNITAPNSVVELGANIIFQVRNTSPSVSSQRFERLDCGIMRPGNSSHKVIVAQYAKNSSRFITPSHGIPKDFRDRVSYVGGWSFVIRRIHFEDKSLKMVCRMSFKNGSMTSHSESPVYEVKDIYGKFKTSLNSCVYFLDLLLCKCYCAQIIVKLLTFERRLCIQSL